MTKRVFDVVASSFGLIVFGPLLLILSVLIKLDSRGPVFYKAKRVGEGGRLFGMYKFRTMRADADQISSSPSCANDDPRVTRLGRILRDYKLNELPQLINVLWGDMSVVGPRPEVPSEVATYDEEQKRILSVRPGITDYACLTFHNEGALLNGSSDPHQTYVEKIKPEKLRLALKYVDEMSLWVDIKILFATVFTLVGVRGKTQEKGGASGNAGDSAVTPQRCVVGSRSWSPDRSPSKVPVRDSV